MPASIRNGSIYVVFFDDKEQPIAVGFHRGARQNISAGKSLFVQFGMCLGGVVGCYDTYQNPRFFSNMVGLF